MRWFQPFICMLLFAVLARADVGDPQIRTSHPVYPGEGACANFPKLFDHQEKLYTHLTGRKVETDEDRVLAAWVWRNTHYFHAEEAGRDLWGKGWGKGTDVKEREYWTGLFANGFGLCGTTHAQWVAEMEARLGPGRARTVGTAGHNSFEVYLKGGAYGEGQWVLLDHDLSTVVFDPTGKRLLSISEVSKDWKRLTSAEFQPVRQRGWKPCGLHAGDGASFAKFEVAEYASGYAGPPPRVHLRRGESLRRYLQPGLEDGQTFVFWGRNYQAGNIPGPERSRTWVNQPELMFAGKQSQAPYRVGQARYGNAVYTYTPNFVNNDDREAFQTDEKTRAEIFYFRTPYIIAATPANNEPWGVYQPGCKNGLILTGQGVGTVAVSLDRGQSWTAEFPFTDGLDLTDTVKGSQQYLLRFSARQDELAKSGLRIRTVCQANPSTMPQLTGNGCTIDFESRGLATASAGPGVSTGTPTLGGFQQETIGLKLTGPKSETVRTVYAAAHILSSSPPDPNIRYTIEVSDQPEGNWKPISKDWRIIRKGEEPKDFWSQAMQSGQASLLSTGKTIYTRFTNTGRKKYARAEMHIDYVVGNQDDVEITFAWTEPGKTAVQLHRHLATQSAGVRYEIPTGEKPTTRWVDMKVSNRK